MGPGILRSDARRFPLGESARSEFAKPVLARLSPWFGPGKDRGVRNAVGTATEKSLVQYGSRGLLPTHNLANRLHQYPRDGNRSRLRGEAPAFLAAVYCRAWRGGHHHPVRPARCPDRCGGGVYVKLSRTAATDRPVKGTVPRSGESAECCQCGFGRLVQNLEQRLRCASRAALALFPVANGV